MTAYAVVGMQLLKGLFYKCDDGDWAEHDEYLATVGAFPTNSPRYGDTNNNGLYTARPCTGNFTNSSGSHLEAKGEWVNSLYNFDSFGDALLSVFILSVGGWGELVQEGLAATEIDYSPEPYANTSPLVIFYFFFGVAFFGLCKFILCLRVSFLI